VSWWRVYYSDRVFTDADGEPFDAPRTDAQVVVQEKDGDYELVHGRDYFYYEPERGGWHCSDIFGAFDHLIRSNRQCLLIGRMMSDPDWKALFERVKADCGPRSARYAREYHRG
jgi:hypothetical protein